MLTKQFVPPFPVSSFSLERNPVHEYVTLALIQNYSFEEMK